jgi:membrane-associated phospholipid phosphatase
VGIALFVAFTALVFLASPAQRLDSAALQGFQIGPHSAEPTNVHRVAHSAMDVPVIILSAILVAVALLRRRPERAVAAVVLVTGAGALTEVLKHALAHSRAVDAAAAYQVNPVSYPSGHATVTMSLALAAVIVVPRRFGPVAATVGATWTAAVSFAMLILHRHFPSDVLAGYVVAGVWCLCIIAALRIAEGRLARPSELHQFRRRRAVRPMIAVASVAAFLAALIAVDTIAEGQTANHRAGAVVVAVTIVAAVGLIATLGAIAGRSGQPGDTRYGRRSPTVEAGRSP